MTALAIAIGVVGVVWAVAYAFVRVYGSVKNELVPKVLSELGPEMKQRQEALKARLDAHDARLKRLEGPGLAAIAGVRK